MISQPLNLTEAAPQACAPTAELELHFADDAASHRFAAVLVSLIAPQSKGLSALLASGATRTDLDVSALVRRLETQSATNIAFNAVIGRTAASLLLTIRPETRGVVALSVPLAQTGRPHDRWWLQCAPDYLTPLRALQLPVVDGALTPDALHALVALAARTGGLNSASVRIDDTERRWEVKTPGQGAELLGFAGDTYWATRGSDAGSSGVPVGIQFYDTAPERTRSLVDSAWWGHFERLVAAPRDRMDELRSVLAATFDIPFLWGICDLASAPAASFNVPPESDVAAQLVPTENLVWLAVDLDQPVAALADCLVHLCAHCELGHVWPGDARGHWDSPRTVRDSGSGGRHWDREARELVSARVPRPSQRKVTSLQECTPTEKAKLGLWRMMGEMLGANRKLHETAERYQAAAYQRQAAERLVAMLESYSGAMLCDGVGLGKTYVATTVIVHYANMWRDQRAAAGESVASDPFRISVLAPHSVVSTWRREALPSLAHIGVPPGSIRVLAHTQLSRLSSSSGILKADRGRLSDIEHLLLSDLVIVDEAHNFRSMGAARTKVLRDLLRVQPRREIRRRTLLLTATPINNSLEDLRQEVSLLFSQPIWTSSAKLSAEFRAEVRAAVAERCERARLVKPGTDVSGLVVHGNPEAKFSDKIEFRTDMNLGPNILRIGDYLKHQEKELAAQQEAVKAAHATGQALEARQSGRIAEELLDRVVVQRSRAICKEIERHQNSNVELLFRADAGPPQILEYADQYDGIDDVLARFLPLFDDPTAPIGPGRHPPLSLIVYMWYDVGHGLKSAGEVSPVVGLQRILVLKRLESSPVSFLITLLRLTILHAHRLQALLALCTAANDPAKADHLLNALHEQLAGHKPDDLAKIQSLVGVDAAFKPGLPFMAAVSGAYSRDRPAADTDDPPPQLQIFDDAEQVASDLHQKLEQLWPMLPALLQDFDTLLAVIPGLADIVFSRFAPPDWPRRLMAGGEQIDWPRTASWGMRIVTDAKIRQLVGRLLLARRDGQKAIVFSQFSDTIAYLHSVLRACDAFGREQWQVVTRGGLGIGAVDQTEVASLLAATASVTGMTEDRDDVVNSFAPYYRIGPKRPADDDMDLVDSWIASWSAAITRPVDVLLATDVLAEGVNLQDAALLVNYDVHWNPVRMIQRAGRIDRRLNPAIEQVQGFADVEAVAAELRKSAPKYYWHGRPKTEAPVTISMILPKGLEKALLLRERIAVKTLAIDLTLGLERGTGAEAEWMESYVYQGVASLNSLQRDRAIEQLAAAHAGLGAQFESIGIQGTWASSLNGWFRQVGLDDLGTVLARVAARGFSGDPTVHYRLLVPLMVAGVPHWLRTGEDGSSSMFNTLVALDGTNWPPLTCSGAGSPAGLSNPVRAQDLLRVVEELDRAEIEEMSARLRGRMVQQGLTAIAAGHYTGADDHRLVKLLNYFVIEMGPGPLEAGAAHG